MRPNRGPRMSISDRSWFHWLTLTFALIGAVPNMVVVYDYFTRAPTLTYNLESWGSATVGRSQIGIFLIGAVSNSGTEPLSPSSFDLRVFVGKRWVSCTRCFFPNVLETETSDTMETSSQTIDLQKFSGTITNALPIYGVLLFLSDSISQRDLISERNLKFDILCVDVFGKHHSYLIESIARGSGMEKPGDLLRYGIRVKPYRKSL